MLSSKDVPTGKNIPYCTTDLFLLAFLQKISVTASARGKLFSNSALDEELDKSCLYPLPFSFLNIIHSSWFPLIHELIQRNEVPLLSLSPSDSCPISLCCSPSLTHLATLVIHMAKRDFREVYNMIKKPNILIFSKFKSSKFENLQNKRSPVTSAFCLNSKTLLFYTKK